MSKSKAKGTAAETAVVSFLASNGFPYVERRALNGALDLGDITGIPGICIEVKNCKEYTFAAWMRETETERVNARADYGILVVKPKGVGSTRVDKWWACMYFKPFNLLVDEAGAFPGSWLVKRMSGRAINRDIGPAMSELVRSCAEHGTDPMLWIDPIRVEDTNFWYSITTLGTLSGLLVAAGYGRLRDVGQAAVEGQGGGGSVEGQLQDGVLVGGQGRDRVVEVAPWWDSDS